MPVGGFRAPGTSTSTHSLSARRVLEGGALVALTSAAFIPDVTLPAIRLTEDVEVRVTVGWRRGGTVTDVAHWIVRWLRGAQVRRLAAIRPELLAEMRADPGRWPHLTDV